MREIYASPRDENIERVVALLAEHDIETKVNNRSSYQRPGHKRFSYANPGDASRWPQVEVRFANDLTRARAILRKAGLKPLTRHAEVLADARANGDTERVMQAHKNLTKRVRIHMLVAIAIAIVLMILKMRQVF